MRFVFTLQDVQEIFFNACRAFLSTFHYNLEESDLSDFDPDIFGCGEIRPEVEKMVESNWEICGPIDEVFGPTTSKLIKATVTSATEEEQCAGLNFFKYIAPGKDKDRDLIHTCLGVSYWCCCETVKKVSPIIAEATSNFWNLSITV